MSFLDRLRLVTGASKPQRRPTSAEVLSGGEWSEIRSTIVERHFALAELARAWICAPHLCCLYPIAFCQPLFYQPEYFEEKMESLRSFFLVHAGLEFTHYLVDLQQYRCRKPRCVFNQ